MAKKILVVDDDVSSLKLTESVLKSAGYDVLTLDYPKYVLKVIKEEKPALVVLDIIMPYKDGYALCEEIKKIFCNKIPVLLCTAKSYEQDLIEKAYKDFGADDFIIKPFEAEDLLQKIKALTEGQG
ncbi:MAG: response regulator transcription factor [Candidatus Omnitrophota bacterium]|nr:response regulator transcription factor [Candidatus Omnitrophota bacterium]